MLRVFIAGSVNLFVGRIVYLAQCVELLDEHRTVRTRLI